MKIIVLCVSFNFLFSIDTVYSTVKVEPAESVVVFNPKQSPKQALRLSCNISYTGEKLKEKPDIEWFRNGTKVTEIDDLKTRAKSKWEDTQNVLIIESTNDNDAGNYSCRASIKGEEKGDAEFVVRRLVAVKVPSNVNVIEEEALRIECKVLGNPKLSWRFKNETYDISRGRVILENYTDEGKVIENGVFIVENIQEDDRGNVTCVGEDLYSHETDEDNSMIRIRDKYAALWPFLGICAEVVILCAIIVIYEKKRNKTELEESDTDQSPDQKNTPDHGKDANLRHRQ